MGKSPVLSDDGSHTLVSPIYGVSYHSHHGAVQETKHVFIQAGFQYAIERGLDSIRILEMGFGTGLNALMTHIECQKHHTPCIYHTIEAYPIELETVKMLNYQEVLGHSDVIHQGYLDMHNSPSHVSVELDTRFTFKKYIGKIEDTELPLDYFDVVYYDAFAPNAQEELWDVPIMTKMYQALSDGGCLVTYCAKGSFKRTLRAVGFTIEELPGPKGKREMTRAIKKVI